jgi:hypothetical protein
VIDSIGVEIGDSDYMFGRANSATFASDGSIVILDDMRCTVGFFTPEYEHVRTVDIGGEGPGQFRSPSAIQSLPDGGFLVYGVMDRKMAFFDSEMHLQNEILSTSSNRRGPYQAVPLSDSTVVARFFEFSPAGDSVSNIILVTDGVTETVITRRSAPLDEHYRWQLLTGLFFCSMSDGSILVSERSLDEWKVLRFDQEGRILDSLQREYEPLHKSDSLLAAELEAARQDWLNAFGTLNGFEHVQEEYFPAITGLHSDQEGRIWVQHGPYNAPVFDVVTREGILQFVCRFDAPTWQHCFAWNVIISGRGYLAGLLNPEQYHLIYRLDLVRSDSAD